MSHLGLHYLLMPGCPNTKKKYGNIITLVQTARLYIKSLSFSEDGYIDFEEYFAVMRAKMFTLDFEKERMKTAFKG